VLTGLKKEGVSAHTNGTDLRPWCSEVKDQESLDSYTANAGIELVVHYMRRVFSKRINGSRLFLYKTTLDQVGTGNTRTYLRSTMEAMALFGIPPEQEISNYDLQPRAFLYSCAASYKALKYYRPDPGGTTPDHLLSTIKSSNEAYGLPAMFGFTIYSSSVQASAANQGAIPMPAAGKKRVGGQAVVAVGYNDTIQNDTIQNDTIPITNSALPAPPAPVPC
jgi:C1A family cysteine protease